MSEPYTTKVPSDMSEPRPAKGIAARILRLIGAASSPAFASPVYPKKCITRVISVDPTALRQVGTAQYAQTLPLRDHEVVLSFDDGPKRGRTEQVLDALAAECVKANFFIFGDRAKHWPDLVRRAYQEGHAIGTHTQTHADISKLSYAEAVREITSGIQSVQAALGSQMKVAPFFRAPWLHMTPDLEHFLFKQGLMLWSIDIDAEDWRVQSPKDIVKHTLNCLKAKRSGIILLHDAEPHTPAAIPMLLHELRKRDYSIVQAVASGDSGPMNQNKMEPIYGQAAKDCR